MATTIPPAAHPSGNRILRWLTFSLFFLFALTSESVGVIIPAVIAEFKIGMTVAGMFHYATMAGIALGGVVLGSVIDRLGAKQGILIGLAAFGVSCALFAVTHRFQAFVLLLFLGGLSIGLFKTAALAMIGNVAGTPREHTQTMNMAEGFFGIGAIVGPAIVALLLGAGYSWKWLYVIAAVICFLVASMTLLVRFPARAAQPVAQPTDHAAGSVRAMIALLRDPAVLGFAGAAILYVGVETAIYVWMPTLLTAHAGNWPLLSAYALSAFFVLRAAGRFVGAWLMGVLAWEQVLMVSTGAILLCFAGALFSPGHLAVFLLPLSGLFMSVVYPTINSKALSCFPASQHGSVAGIILFFTCLSAVVSPLAMGIMGDVSGDPLTGFALAGAFAVALCAAAVANAIWKPVRMRLAHG